MTRRSLSVGINDYQRSPLRGCVNDATDWDEALRERGYAEREVLLDRSASKVYLLDRLAALVEGARWGDRLVFTFSGHGTWMPDADGDEPDNRDEALVAADMRTISDDELYLVIGGVPRGVRLTIVSDSCHSGSVSRFMMQPAIEVEEPGQAWAQPRFIDPALLPAQPRLDLPPRGLPARAMLLSGCADQEVSYDAHIGGRFRGAMTTAALEVLPVSTSMKDWHARTLGALRYPQTPQLAATTYQRRLRPFS